MKAMDECVAQVFSEPSQTSKMELLAKLVNGFQLLNNSAKAPS